jgi:hypothetical protein
MRGRYWIDSFGWTEDAFSPAIAIPLDHQPGDLQPDLPTGMSAYFLRV